MSKQKHDIKQTISFVYKEDKSAIMPPLKKHEFWIGLFDIKKQNKNKSKIVEKHKLVFNNGKRLDFDKITKHPKITNEIIDENKKISGIIIFKFIESVLFNII